MKTPQEKAEELIEKFNDLIPLEASFTDTVDEAVRKVDNDYKASIECALLHVEGIIEELTEQISPSIHGDRHQYWSEVKQILQTKNTD